MRTFSIDRNTVEKFEEEEEGEGEEEEEEEEDEFRSES